MITVKPGEVFDAFIDMDQTEAYYIQLDGNESHEVLSRGGLWPDVFSYSKLPVELLTLIMDNFADQKQHDRLTSIGFSLIPLAYEDARKSCGSPLAFEMCSYIHQNWNNATLNVDTLLDHFSVSRSSASQKFKDFTGSSILDYIMNLRSKESVQMLQDKVLPVQDIAFQCGFTDATYFSNWFRKKHGTSPNAVRLHGSPG